MPCLLWMVVCWSHCSNASIARQTMRVARCVRTDCKCMRRTAEHPDWPFRLLRQSSSMAIGLEPVIRERSPSDFSMPSFQEETAPTCRPITLLSGLWARPAAPWPALRRQFARSLFGHMAPRWPSDAWRADPFTCLLFCHHLRGTKMESECSTIAALGLGDSSTGILRNLEMLSVTGDSLRPAL